MPEPKTIEIDEVLPADGGGNIKSARSASNRKDEAAAPPFPDLTSSLGWKTRLTLQLTQWFLFLRSKSWGKWVIGPLVVLIVLLAIPLALLAFFALIILSIIRSFSPNRPAR